MLPYLRICGLMRKVKVARTFMGKPQMSGQYMASNRARAHTRRTAYHEVLQENNKSGHQYMASNRARAHTHCTAYHELLQENKAYIPLQRKIPGVGGWRWAMPPKPEFCVGDTNMLVSWSQRKPLNLRYPRRQT